MNILMLIVTVFMIIQEMFHGRIFLNSSASAAPSEFCERIHIGIDVYIPHCKDKFKHHSSSWFSAACAAAIVHRSLFLFLPAE